MKTFRFIFLVIIFSYTQNLYSQNLGGKEYLINFKIDSAIFTNFDFYISEVIDARDNKDNIGYIMRGPFQTNRPIDFKEGLEHSFLEYLNKIIINKNSNAEPIKLRIRELNVSEFDLGIGEEALCSLTMEFLDSTNNLIYMTYYKYETIAFNVTKKHEDIIRKLIKKSLYIFSLYNRKSNLYYNLLGKQNLYYSLILAEKPKKGFYINFKELQANNPSLQFDFEMITIKEDGKEYTKIKFADPMFDFRKLTDLIYGFSNGEIVYIKNMLINKDFNFVPVKDIGKYSYIGKRIDSQGAPIILPFDFGVLFGVFSIPYEQDYILNLSSGKEYPLRRVDMGLYWIEQFNKRYKEKLKRSQTL
jgi:hypothetical protein